MHTLYDALNLLSKLTPRKVGNLLKILISYRLSKLFSRNLHRGLPFSIAFEPTTACNLRCPECPSGLRNFTRPTGMLQEDLFKKNIDELKEVLVYLIFYFQGEPYLHPRFLEWVTYASQKGIYTATSTNAHFLDDKNAEKTVRSGLDRLIISIDGTTQESYSAYRIGGNLEKVKEGTRNIVAWKKKLASKTPIVIFQFLVTGPNEHQIEDVKILAKELGVDTVWFKTAQIYDYAQGSPLIPKNEKYARYKKQADGSYVIKNSLLNHCWKMWHSCVITWNGSVVPCCFDKDARHSLGDAGQQSFTEVWRGEVYRRFRTSLIKARSEIDICKNCTEGTKVWG